MLELKRIGLLLCLCLAMACSVSLAGGETIGRFTGPGLEMALQKGEEFPNLLLAGRLSKDAAQYLGIGPSEEPRINSIDAGVVLVEVFSMYCPFCQKEAPAVNELHKLVEASPYRDRIRLLGIGAGNSEFEVDTFRKKYSVGFPLLADEDFSAHKALGSVGTPTFYAISRKSQNGPYTVLFSHLGGFDSPKAFLERLVDQAGLGKE